LINNNLRKKPLAVIIMAAGKGTRMNSDLPKVLHHIKGRPMVMYVVDLAREIGAEKIIVIVGHSYQLVEKTLKKENVAFAYQLEQLGTGHAVMQCCEQLKDFEGDVLVLSGDVPMLTTSTIENLLLTQEQSGVVATVLTADFQDPSGYGRVVRKEDDSLERIVEHQDANDEELSLIEINAGIYVFDSQTLFRLLPMIGNKNEQGEYYLPDVIPMILQENSKVAIDKTKKNAEIQGVNTIEQLELLNENEN